MLRRVAARPGYSRLIADRGDDHEGRAQREPEGSGRERQPAAGLRFEPSLIHSCDPEHGATPVAAVPPPRGARPR